MFLALLLRCNTDGLSLKILNVKFLVMLWLSLFNITPSGKAFVTLLPAAKLFARGLPLVAMSCEGRKSFCGKLFLYCNLTVKLR